MCYFPLDGWLAAKKNENGKREVVFSISQALVDKPVQVPCGKCIGCRLQYSRSWAIRMCHESYFYDDTIFLTLTFDDYHLYKRPNPYTIDVLEMQKFFKDLRNKYGSGIRNFYCGEYGDENLRPHYHAIVFNFDFPDKELWSVRDGYRLYRSAALEKLWPYGFSTIGSFSFESAGYVARYVTKKIGGDLAAEPDEQGLTHYEILCPDTGQIFNRIPEFCNQSRRPGLGRAYYDKYKHYIFDNDHCVIDGIPYQVPKYYNDLYAKEHPDLYMHVKRKRLASMREKSQDNTSRRLLDKYRIKLRQFSKLVRNL